ncbi:kinase-like protein [Schizopora paradoxa]|uniref:Kinase-like protein n=1 Tax=Schizopora paradoxa TaxID=27342 RepID=A0A0H2RYF0_9AGAM|nr:kinase-like protein [Schizopora paradoxa]
MRRELLEFRPPANGIYEALDDFFPDCDLDKPPPSASTPTDSPTAVEPDAQEFRFTVRRDKQVRRSIRVVAAERHRRLSDPNAFLQPTIFERHRDISRERLNGETSDLPSSSRNQEVSHNRPYNWVRGQAIGRGTNSHIFLAMDGRTGELFALKRAELPLMHHDSRQAIVIDAMRRESGILKTVSHENIVKYIGQTETSEHVHIFLEYVPGGNMADTLKRHGKFADQAIRSFTGQILSALEHIHDRGVIHCELKSDNILIDPSGVCKLCDFGNARRITSLTEPTSNTSASSPYASSPSWQMAIWVAPEIMRAAKNSEHYVYDCKADIWGLGCVVLEMVAGKQPWGDAVMFEVSTRVSSRMLPPVPTEIELLPDLDDFRHKCLSNYANERLTATELLRHPYLVLPRDWTFRGFS